MLAAYANVVLLTLKVDTSEEALSCSEPLASISPGAEITCSAIIKYRVNQVRPKYLPEHSFRYS